MAAWPWFRSLEISASGLTAERLRMDVIAQNIANAGATRTAEGGPYRRRVAVLAAREGPDFAAALAGAAGAGSPAWPWAAAWPWAPPWPGVPVEGPALAALRPGPWALWAAAPGAEAGAGGVRVAAIGVDPRPARLKYDPGHPDAGPDGYVALPNLDPVTEMVDLIAATRAYEANVTALGAAKAMFLRALEIGRS